jgi:hypothetical protein
MAIVRATLTVEFETTNELVAMPALVRLAGGIRHSIQFPKQLGRMSGLVENSVM